MRRALVVLALLSGLGFFTARAATFSTNAEDVRSFTTSVSITVPTTTPCTSPVAFAVPAWIRTLGGQRVLDLGTPDAPTPDAVDQQTVVWSTGGTSVASQAAGNALVRWSTAPTVAPPCGWLLPSPVTVSLRTTLTFTVRVNTALQAQAGLFACDVGAPAATTTATPPVTPGCRLLGTGVAEMDAGVDRPLSVPLTLTAPGTGPHVPAGQELRLKVITARAATGPLASYAGSDPIVRWGYTAAVPTRLG